MDVTIVRWKDETGYNFEPHLEGEENETELSDERESKIMVFTFSEPFIEKEIDNMLNDPVMVEHMIMVDANIKAEIVEVGRSMLRNELYVGDYAKLCRKMARPIVIEYLIGDKIAELRAEVEA